MSGWILILAMWSADKVAITTQKYATEKHCQQAGEAARELSKGVFWNIRYVCTPAGV
jgi:hypothetical protein